MKPLPPIYSGPGIFVGWKDVPIIPSNEPMLPLGAFSPYSDAAILSESMYAGETCTSPYDYGDLMGSLLTPFLRESVAEKLVKASQLLPRGVYLVIADAYRPVTVQKALFDNLLQQYLAQGLCRSEADAKTQEFLSRPSSNPLNPSPHNTGGSVDLTLVSLDESDIGQEEFLSALIRETRGIPDKANLLYAAEIARLSLFRTKERELDMGCAVDELCEEAPSAYYEQYPDDEKEIIRENRRLLHHVMSSVGFTNYHNEWWHFDFGNQIDALKKGTYAVHGPAVLDEACMQHENHLQRAYHQFPDVMSGRRPVTREDLTSYVRDGDLLEAIVPKVGIEHVAYQTIRIARITL